MVEKSSLIEKIRARFDADRLDAVIVPYTDPHQSEYIPAHWKFREWLTHFTGSAGVVVITRDFAGLWTDSRYFLQAEQELAGSGFEVVRLAVPHTPEYIGWLKERLASGSTVGIDDRFFPISMIRYYRDCLASGKIQIKTNVSFLPSLWENRPPLPMKPVFQLALKYAGVSRKQKIAAVRERLKETGADYQFISPLDEVAWLYNLRGSDVQFCPVFVAYAIVGHSDALLFAHRKAISPDLVCQLEQEGITVLEYEDLLSWIEQVNGQPIICLAPEKTTGSIYSAFAGKGSILEGMNSTTALKAIKNSTEADGIRQANLRDGIAWVKTLYWLKNTLATGTHVTELEVARQIAANRAKDAHYQGESFHPISSYGPHGAIVHYSVTEESSIELNPDGIFLLDSGGQYFDGTTDTTRTIALGSPTPGQKRDFTLALKGTLAVSMIRFPAGTRGYQLDVLARMALWQDGKNYGHGTGHGVGHFLNVHEGPQTIGTSASGYLTVTLEPGMVTTVEPAVYKEGEYGMRTENMTLVVEDGQTSHGSFYRFETLTRVPIDRNLIDTSLLSPAERQWIDSYHDKVMKELSPYLDTEERQWLLAATKPLEN